MLTLACQRWRDRRETQVPAGTLINPLELDVDVIPERVARPFVVQHHYSGTYPAARLAVGLFRRRELVGAAVFSVPMNEKAIPAWTGVDSASGTELGRLVLLDEVAGNGESWFIARAFRALRREKPALEAVLSYADPVPRLNAHGSVVKPGHVGTIYQALSARYGGRARARTDYFTPWGEHVSRRALSKIRLEETGAGYAIEQLHRLGAPRREEFEPGRDWLERLMEERFLRTSRHPGNHTYVFPLTRRARAAAKGLADLPYPKIDFIA